MTKIAELRQRTSLKYIYVSSAVDNGIPLEPLAHHKGCYRPAHIYGGHALEKPSAAACFAQCQWKGTIGLKVSNSMI